MAVANAKVPPALAREFEALGVPLVTHRLTRFKDARLREAAHLWLAEQRLQHEAARVRAEQAAERRSRHRLILAVAASLLGWAVLALAIVLR
jgi:hypothetical protein